MDKHRYIFEACNRSNFAYGHHQLLLIENQLLRGEAKKCDYMFASCRRSNEVCSCSSMMQQLSYHNGTYVPCNCLLSIYRVNDTDYKYTGFQEAVKGETLNDKVNKVYGYIFSTCKKQNLKIPSHFQSTRSVNKKDYNYIFSSCYHAGYTNHPHRYVFAGCNKFY